MTHQTPNLSFDPYEYWLGVPPTEQPANHYRLLGLKAFETDAVHIQRTADHWLAFFGSLLGGDYAAPAKQLHDEVSAASAVLLDVNQKQQYDAWLRQSQATNVANPVNPSQSEPMFTPISTPAAMPPGSGEPANVPSSSPAHDRNSSLMPPGGAVAAPGSPQSPTTSGSMGMSAPANSLFPPGQGPPTPSTGTNECALSPPGLPAPVGNSASASPPTVGGETPLASAPAPTNMAPPSPATQEQPLSAPASSSSFPAPPSVPFSSAAQPGAAMGTGGFVGSSPTGSPIIPQTPGTVPGPIAGASPLSVSPAAAVPTAAAVPHSVLPPSVNPNIPQSAMNQPGGPVPSAPAGVPQSALHQTSMTTMPGVGMTQPPGVGMPVGAAVPMGVGAADPNAAAGSEFEDEESAPFLSTPLLGGAIGVGVAILLLGIFSLRQRALDSQDNQTASVNQSSDDQNGDKQDQDGKSDDVANASAASKKQDDPKSGANSNHKQNSANPNVKIPKVVPPPNQLKNPRPNQVPPTVVTSPPTKIGPTVVTSPPTKIGPRVVTSPPMKVEPKVVKPPVAPPETKQIKAFQEAANQFRQAMADRQLKIAAGHLNRAESMAVSDDQQKEVQRLKLIQEYLAQFWVAYAEGRKNTMLEGGSPLNLDGRVVAVVEASQDKLTVKDAGRLRRFEGDQIPTEWILMFANVWFRPVASTKVYIGAFHAMDREGDRGKARELWEGARRSGIPGVEQSAATLLPELDVKRSPGPGAGVPDS